MFDKLVQNADQYINTNPWLAIVAVFIGGLLTASNPCVLSMIPLMMSFVAGRRDETPGVLRALGFSFVFVLGLSFTFTVMGMVAAQIDGATLIELDKAKRVRVRAGWFSRGIYASDREKGPGWKGYPLKGKALAQEWVEFYKHLPNFVA